MLRNVSLLHIRQTSEKIQSVIFREFSFHYTDWSALLEEPGVFTNEKTIWNRLDHNRPHGAHATSGCHLTYLILQFHINLGPFKHISFIDFQWRQVFWLEARLCLNPEWWRLCQAYCYNKDTNTQHKYRACASTYHRDTSMGSSSSSFFLHCSSQLAMCSLQLWLIECTWRLISRDVERAAAQNHQCQ